MTYPGFKPGTFGVAVSTPPFMSSFIKPLKNSQKTLKKSKKKCTKNLLKTL
jgi:hypothetical protein